MATSTLDLHDAEANDCCDDGTLRDSANALVNIWTVSAVMQPTLSVG
jgi:hypothetical protein